ncbi:hypothetical protein D3C73_1653700 [compost metagenome]
MLVMASMPTAIASHRLASRIPIAAAIATSMLAPAALSISTMAASVVPTPPGTKDAAPASIAIG